MQNTALTLFLDTTQPTQTIALWDAAQDKILTIHTDNQPRPSSRLHTTLQDILAQNHVTFSQIQCLILTLGPGSFTGIRVGLAFAQALKLANPNVSIRTLTTFQAVSLSQDNSAPHTITLDSHSKELFTQTFKTAGEPAADPKIEPKPSNYTFTAHTLNPQNIVAQTHTFSTNLTPLYLKSLNFRKITR